MAYYGSWKIDDLLTFACNTHNVATGAATDADSVPSWRCYEDETGTAILTGSMAKLDDAGTTGFYSEQIALSAANGFEKGKCYTVYISATVNSITGTMHHTFQLEAEVDANRVNWANVDNPTTTVGLSGTTVKTATDVEADTADIQSRLPAALVSGRIDASVGAMATDTLTSGALAASAVTEIQSGLSTLDAAGVRAAIGLASANLDTQIASRASQTSVDDLPTNSELSTALASADDATLAAIATLSGKVDAVDDFLDTAVAAIKAKTDNLPSDPADASDIATAFSTVNTSLSTVAGYLDTEIAAIKAKTDNLPSDPADASDIAAAFVTVNSKLDTIDDFLDTEVGAIKTVTDAIGATGTGLTAIPWNTAWDAEVQSEVEDALDVTLADSVPADGTRPSVRQALYILTQFMMEKSVSGTTVTVRKADGSTTLLTLTLNDATNPTSITRAS